MSVVYSRSSPSAGLYANVVRTVWPDLTREVPSEALAVSSPPAEDWRQAPTFARRRHPERVCWGCEQRIAGDLASDFELRRAGGLGNALALVLFAAVAVVTRAGPQRS